MVLVYIDGGPPDFAGKAFDSDVLLNHPAFVAIQGDYSWTAETKASQRDPSLVAQVWRHRNASAPIPTAAEDTNSLANVDTVTSEPSPPFAGAASSTSASPAEALASSPAAQAEMVSAPPAGDYTGAPIEVGDDSDLPDGDTLFLRRRKLKLSVQQVADGTGLARSKVDSIEKGTGKRVKPGEVRAVADFLASLEQPQPQPQAEVAPEPPR
jgi:hypothetical protein